MAIQRNAQSFYLTSNLQTAVVGPGVPFTITSTSALNLLMDSLYFQCGGFAPVERHAVFCIPTKQQLRYRRY